MNAPQLIWPEVLASLHEAEMAALDELLAQLENVEALYEEMGDENYLEALRPFAALTRDRRNGCRSTAARLRAQENGR